MSATTEHAELADATGAATARTLAPAEIAWVALIPCALVALAAIVVLGPPLGHLLVRPSSDALWPPGWWEAQGSPEPVERGRYALAALAPALLAAAVVMGTRRGLALGPRTIRAVTLASQLLLLAVVVVAVLAQNAVILVDDPPLLNQPHREIFGFGSIAAAAALLAAALLALRRHGVAARLARLARETRGRRATGLAIAVLLAAVWLLQVVTTDRISEDLGAFNWTLNDTFAVLNGRTPLVDYHIIYGKLFPYPTALALALFGETGLVYTVTLALLSALTLVAVYAIFRRLVRSSLLALVLFAPFVAMSDMEHTLNVHGMWPMRYGGAYLLAWMTARAIDRRVPPRHGWLLFFAGGLVTVNNLEFGLGAVAASLAALLCARFPRTRRAWLRLAGEAAGGMLAAVALVALLTLVRAGTLPRLDNLLAWPRIFNDLGWFSLPIPVASLHLALYATFAATIAVAAVRLVRKDEDGLLTSMLMWSGVFGLIAGSYYSGRSDDLKLIYLFSAWSFALTLLTIVCVRALAARGWRAPTLPELLVLFAVALAIVSVSWVSPPQTEIARLTGSPPDPVYRADAKRFVRERTEPGDAVAVLLPEGYRIAHELGLENVAPYGFTNAIVTVSQMNALIETLRDERVHHVFLPVPGISLAHEGQTAPQQVDALVAAGYRPTAEWAGFLELSDR